MPIRDKVREPRLPRLGKIHLGVKKVSERTGGEYPSAVDFFVVKEDASTPPEMVQAFRDVYPEEQPRQLDIMFPTDDQAQWADSWYRSYSASQGLVCRGDGETASAKWDVEAVNDEPLPTGAGWWASGRTEGWVRREIPCAGKECPMQKKGMCKAVMNLQFILYRVRGLGVWQIDTGSFYSMESVNDNLRMIAAVTGGHFRGVPLTLGLRTMEVTPEGEKKKNVYVLNLTQYGAHPADVAAKVLQPGEGLLLPAPEFDDEEPPEDLMPAAADGLDVDVKTGEIIEGKVTLIKPLLPPQVDGVTYGPDGQVTAITSLGALLNLCLAEFKMDKAGVEKILGSEDREKGLLAGDWIGAYRLIQGKIEVKA